MDFTQAQQIAREWVESQSVDVTLLYADEDDCVLFFTVATQPGGDESSSVCFNVGCPRKNRKQTFVSFINKIKWLNDKHACMSVKP